MWWMEAVQKMELRFKELQAKEKEFELEMTWIGAETNGLHLPVPQDLLKEAEDKAKAALEDFE